MNDNMYSFFETQNCLNVKCIPHIHHRNEFICVTEGSVNVSLADRELTVGAKHALFLPSYCVHSYKSPDFSQSIILEFSPDVIIEKFSDNIILFPLSEQIEMLIKHELNVLHDKDNIFTKKAIIYALAAECSQSPKISFNINTTFSKALQFISENFREPLTLMMLAKNCNVNYTYLSRMFCKCMGMSFTQCLNNVRIHYTISLLLNTDKNISEIALECGFGSIRNFNRVFSKLMGCAPVEFKACRNQYYGF